MADRIKILNLTHSDCCKSKYKAKENSIEIHVQWSNQAQSDTVPHILSQGHRQKFQETKDQHFLENQAEIPRKRDFRTCC